MKRIEDLEYNLLLDTDSYKFSHYKQYPEGTERMQSYMESRGGDFSECTIFGLQYIMHKYLSKPITKSNVEEAKVFATKHGVLFNYDGWMHVVNKYGGKLPVTIRCIPEGTIVPVGNALLTVESNDPKCFWICSYLETMLLRLWATSTVAINSREIKKVIKSFMEKSSMTPEDIMFRVHCFGARGIASKEQDMNTGAHLLSFLGSDTVGGINWLNHYYHSDMSAFSISATEHSTVTMHGRKGEHQFFFDFVQKNLVEGEFPEGAPRVIACVIDSYNVWDAIDVFSSKKMIDLIRSANGTVVLRPDSGPPVLTLSKIFEKLEKNLGKLVDVNEFGYKVLPKELRILQGDGVDLQMIENILTHLVDEKKWSAENISYGSGGGLIQKFNRDTQKWAFKCCAAWINGKQVDVRKDPITDPGKRSKSGRLDLVYRNGQYQTIAIPDGEDYSDDSAMDIVFCHGDILVNTTLDECRERMKL